MSLTSRAAVLDGVRGKFTIREEAVPEPAPGSLILKQELCGICGTDVHVYQGHMPVPSPVVLGHEVVGTIARLGEGVTHDSTGRPVSEGDLIGLKPGVANNDEFFGTIAHQPNLSPGYGAYGFAAPNLTKKLPLAVTGGYSSYQWLVPQAKFYKMNADPVAASILEPLSVGLHAAGRARYAIGDTVVIQGAGPIGLMCLIGAKELGAHKTIVIGAPADRLEFARELGADMTIDLNEVTDQFERAQLVREASTHGYGADIVIEATGVLSALPEGFGFLRRGGQYVTCGHFTNVGDVPLNPYAHFTFKHISLFGVWGSAHEHFVQARTLIETAAYPFAKFVSHQIPLDRTAEGIKAMSGTYMLDGQPVRKIAIRGE